jgi:hypothetical protein
MMDSHRVTITPVDIPTQLYDIKQHDLHPCNKRSFAFTIAADCIAGDRSS